MPELPDVLAYVDALRPRVTGRRIRRIGIPGPFFLRSIEPPIEAASDKRVLGVTRLGKRIILDLDDDLHLVLHLMVAGRLRWFDDERSLRAVGKPGLCAIAFDQGTLIVTEASRKKRASLHLVAGADALADFDRGGIDPIASDLAAFTRAIRTKGHTLKRALTDPRLFDGIGNAYSDEILHAARMSPFKRTTDLTENEIARLHDATRTTLTRWIDELAREFKQGAVFPGPAKITAFRPGFAVHAKFDQPCPVCNTPVQRVVYAENEMNYCPTCQTEGRILADRSLSRLLKGDWPKTVDELE
jgi:formamidopyrimidine-DNA glycosylase